MATEVLIKILLPDDAEVSVVSGDSELSVESREGSGSDAAPADTSEFERYWRYLTDNSRELFSAMARQQLEAGPFTYEDIADRMGVPRETLYAYKRNEG